MNEILDLKKNKVVYSNGCYAICYTVELPEKYSLGEEDYLSLNDYWNKAIKDLPVGTIFYKQDVFLKEEFSTNIFPEENFLQKATKKYFDKRTFLNHTCNLFFIVPSNDFISTSLVNPFKKLNKEKFDWFDEKVKLLDERVSEIVGFLNNIKLQGGNTLKVVPMEEKQIENYTDLYFNLFDDNFISDRFFEKDYFKVGDKYANVVALVDEKKMPDVLTKTRKDRNLSTDKSLFFKNYGDNFGFDLDFSHIYNQICIVDDTRTHLNELKKRNDQLHKSSSFDNHNKVMAKATDEIIQEITEAFDTTSLIRGHNNIIIIADSKEELKGNSLKVAEQFRDIDIKAWLPKDNFLNVVFHYSFPFFSQYFTDKQLYVSSIEIFSSFLNNTSLFKNDKKGIVYNSRLSNVPVKIDVWDEDKKYINARNFFILAPTGFGKSFNANHLITHYYSEGVKIVIVDLGGSYKKVASLFPEDTAYITYKPGDTLGINPFDVDDVDTDVLNDLIEFISIHYNKEELSEEARTSLRKILKMFYETNPFEPSLPTFVKWVKLKQKTIIEEQEIKKDYFDLDKFVYLMSEYVDDGSYSFLYKNDNEEAFISGIKDKSIVVFELDKAKDDKLLLALMLQLIGTVTKKIIWEDKSNKGIILYDEVAEQLKWDGVLRRIQYQYQAIRKQNGAVGMILQSESQLPDNPLSTAIVDNTQVLYVLNAKDYRSLQHRFKLSEHAYYQLCSIQSNFDKNSQYQYSELFILRGNHHQIYRLEVPKEVYWAYQTEGAQNEKLLNRADEIGMENAINEFITKEY